MIKKFIDKLLGKTGSRAGKPRFGKREEIAVDVHGIDPKLVDERALNVVRTLKQGVAHDPSVSLLPTIRELATTLDATRAEGDPRVGALATLAALQQYVGATVDPNAKINLLKQRAELREKQLGDPQGAMAEWLRILQLHPGSDEARFELDRLAERENLWHLVLLVPAWELAQKPGKKDQHRLLGQIADLYEQNLGRPEYALRARIAAWRLNAAGPADLPSIVKDPRWQSFTANPRPCTAERRLRWRSALPSRPAGRKPQAPTTSWRRCSCSAAPFQSSPPPAGATCRCRSRRCRPACSAPIS